MKFNTRFSPPVSAGLECGASMTFQHFKDECDINTIVARYPNGVTPYDDRKGSEIYGDFSDAELFDFRATQEKIIEAENRFNALPSDVRSRFGNNPAELLDFLNDSSNYDEAVRLGLIHAKVSNDVAPDNSVPVDNPSSD